MSEQESKKLCPRMLISVIHAENIKKMDESLEELQIPVFYRCRGKGTASSEMMDIFGLRGTARILTISFLPKSRVKEVFACMENHMCFRKRGGGIAFTIPITGMQGPMLRLIQEQQKKGDGAEMKETPGNSVIWVSVAGGYSEDVVEAARSAGARGGTVMKGGRRGQEQMTQFFGISVQEEQELVMIVVPDEKKTEVMSAINQACGLKTKAHGEVLSLPVDDAIGLA